MHPLGAAASSSPSSPDVPAQPAPQPARPDAARSSALAQLAQRYDLRQLRRQTGDDTDTAPGVAAGAVAVVEHAFRCDLPRLDCIAALRAAWTWFSFVALGQEQAAVAPLPVAVGAVPGVVGVTRASLWPAPMTALSGRRASLASLGRQAGGASLWEAASGALIDDTVAPGVVRLWLMATLEAAWGDGDAGEQADGAEPGPVAQTPVCVAVFDLCAGPRGSHGRVRAVAACWPWVEALIGDAGLSEGWRWTDAGMGAPPAPAVATAAAAPPEGAAHAAAPHGQEQTEQLRALQAAYVTQCRAYAESEDRTRDARNKNRKTPAAPRRPTLREFADAQQMSEATLRRLLRRLGVTWGKDFKSLPLAVDTLED